MKYNYLKDRETLKFYWEQVRQEFDPEDTGDLYLEEADVVEYWEEAKDICEFILKLEKVFFDMKEYMNDIEED